MPLSQRQEPPPLEFVENGTTNIREHRFAIKILSRPSPTNVRVLLDSPLLLSYANSATVNHMDLTGLPVDNANLSSATRAGNSLVIVDDRNGNFDNRTDVVVIDQGNNQEIRRIGELRQVNLTVPISEV